MFGLAQLPTARAGAGLSTASPSLRRRARSGFSASTTALLKVSDAKKGVKWSQTDEEVVISVPLEEGITRKGACRRASAHTVPPRRSTSVRSIDLVYRHAARMRGEGVVRIQVTPLQSPRQGVAAPEKQFIARPLMICLRDCMGSLVKRLFRASSPQLSDIACKILPKKMRLSIKGAEIISGAYCSYQYCNLPLRPSPSAPVTEHSLGVPPPVLVNRGL